MRLKKSQYLLKRKIKSMRCLVLVLVCGCALLRKNELRCNDESEYIRLLTADSLKYWDAKVANNIIFLSPIIYVNLCMIH